MLDWADTTADFFCSGDSNLISMYGEQYPKLFDDAFEEHKGRADARGRFWGPISLIGDSTDLGNRFINSVYDNNQDAHWNGQEY